MSGDNCRLAIVTVPFREYCAQLLFLHTSSLELRIHRFHIREMVSGVIKPSIIVRAGQ